MKTNKIIKLISLFTVLFFITSCVEDGDFETPNISVSDPNITANMTFKNVIDRADGNAAFSIDEDDLYIEGYVISSDKAGNFFEELIIQNKTDDSTSAADPRLGLRIEINTRSLSDTYEVGRKIYVKLNGLAIGLSNGVYTIGKLDGTNIEQIQDFEYKNFIFRDPEVANLTPKSTTITEISENDELTLIQLDDMQFISADLGKTFAGEITDNFDGSRILENCNDFSTINLETSTFADFKSLQVPQLKGSIQGILTRDFFDDNNVLVINNTNDISFDDANRCGAIFAEDFSEAIDNTNLDIVDWTNFAEEGSELWTEQEFGGNGYAEFSGFQTNDAVNIGWLVSPGIDMDAQSNEILRFKTAQHHLDSSDNTLEVFVSTDFDGTNILTATWEPITATLATIDDDWYNFIDSGQIDISGYTGTMYIAFKYTGSGTDSDLDGAFFVDDVSIVVL